MFSARMATNMVLADLANRGVNLWKVELVTTALTQGIATYGVDPSIVMILDAYIALPNGAGGGTTDRIILPVSRTEYASYSNKAQQGSVTTYWHNRLLTPTINLYQTPDGTQPNLKFYAVQQIQDAAFTSGQTLDIPYVWMKAFSDALSAELAVTWAPDRYQLLKGIADQSFEVAAETGTEISQMYVSPQISGYFSP